MTPHTLQKKKKKQFYCRVIQKPKIFESQKEPEIQIEEVYE